MKIRFAYHTPEQEKELKHIVEVEAKKHFGRFISLHSNFGGNVPSVKEDHFCLQIEIWESDFFDDLQRAKQEMYKNGRIMLPDFLSDVEDNLSFVSKVGCV